MKIDDATRQWFYRKNHFFTSFFIDRKKEQEILTLFKTFSHNN